MISIDYQVIADALTHYTSKGYARIEAPWTVTRAVSDLTRPEGCADWYIESKKKTLVASGEQSFLYLYLKGFLPAGKVITVTPCFRDEPFDLTHTKYFLKAELIDTVDASKSRLDEMINTALIFFAENLGKIDHVQNKLEVVPTEDGFDIEYDGYELGSYGIRSCPYLSWIYGTAVAEPRFSTIYHMIKRG